MATMRKTVYMAPYLHYPLVGADDQRTSAARGSGLLRRKLEAARQDQGCRLTLSGLAALQAFMAGNSDEREYFRQLLDAGSFDVNAFFVEPDAAVVQGESLIRNLMYGLLYARGILNVQPVLVIAEDGSGGWPQLPQIAAKLGLEAIISPAPAGASPLHLRLAPDGSELLGAGVEPFLHLGQAEVLRLIETAGADDLPHLNLYRDDAAEPPDWLSHGLNDLLTRGLMVSTPRHFVSEAGEEIPQPRDRMPVIADVASRGAGAAMPRADLRQATRLAENRLLDAEKWATFASLLGARYPDLALDRAWRQTLLGQQRDAHAGALGEAPLVDLLSGCREALDLAGEVEEKALDYITASISAGSGRHAPAGSVPLIVFNSLGWQRTDVCTARVQLEGAFAAGFSLLDEHGKEAPTQLMTRPGKTDQGWAEFVFIAADVPSIGYRTYYLAPADSLPPSAEAALEDVIESDQFCLEADRGEGGGLVRLFDKQAQREVLNRDAGPANEVIALAQNPDPETPGLGLTGRMVRASDESAEMAAMRGPVFSQLLISGELPGKCQLLQEVTVYQGLRRIDLRTTIEGYRGRHELLALSFPLAAEGLPIFEDQFAEVVSRPSQASLESQAGEVLSDLRSARNWVDVGPGPSVKIVDRGQVTGVVPLGARVLIVSGDTDWTAIRPLMQALLSKGIPSVVATDDDAAKETPRCDFAISLRRANLYAQSAMEATHGVRERIDETLKSEEWASVLVPWIDPSHPEQPLPMLVTDAADTISLSRLTDLIAEAITDDRLQVPPSHDLSRMARPVSEYGVALIGRGLAAALDSERRLIAPLFAARGTIASDQSALDLPLIADHRSHVFEHALLPHAGDWRAAGVVRAGLEFNHPLRAVLARADERPAAASSLPIAFSLVAIDSPDVVISAIKAVGNAVADHTSKPSTPGTGFLVRAYEAHGRPVKAQISFGLEPEEAWLADLMEQKTEDLPLARNGWSLPGLLKRRAQPPIVQLDLPSCGIATFGVRLSQPPEAGEPMELGPRVDAVTPAHSEYWEHNSGAAPLGNQPLTLWLGGPIPRGKNTRFTLALSNDCRDREMSGKVRVIAPPEWPLIPKEVPYRIAPASQAVYEVMIVVPPDATPCFLRAITEDGDRVLQDVVPIGDIQPLALSLRREQGAFVVDVENPNHDFVEGEVQLITPVEAWGRLSEGLALAEVTPRAFPLRLEAQQEQSFTFRADGDSDAMWAVAKVSWYGNVQYVTLAP